MSCPKDNKHYCGKIHKTSKDLFECLNDSIHANIDTGADFTQEIKFLLEMRAEETRSECKKEYGVEK